MQHMTRRLVTTAIATAISVIALAAAAVGLSAVLPGSTANAQPGTGPEAYFLRIDGIPGESVDAAHRDQIELLSYAWSSDGKAGVEQPPASPGGGASGRAQVAAIQLTQRVSRASPLLMVAVGNATRFPEATLFVRRGGATPRDYLTIKLTDVTVGSYRTSASAAGTPTDEFTLRFAKVEYAYSPQNADGSSAAAVVRTWDVGTNTGG